MNWLRSNGKFELLPMAKRVPWARGNSVKNGRTETEFSLLLARHGDFRRNLTGPPEPR